MNHLLNLTLKRYFLFLFSISFASILLAPELRRANIFEIPHIIGSLFIYRSNIFSVFSLLFAALTSVFSLQKQNGDIAIAMSGNHSFKTLSPLFLFSLMLSITYLFINSFFLGDAMTYLKKEKALFAKKTKLEVHKIGKETLFHGEDGEHFTLLAENGDITYAKKGTIQNDGLELFYVDRFIKKENGYEKASSFESLFLERNIDSIASLPEVTNTDSLFSLYSAYKNIPPNLQKEKRGILTLLLYRMIIPLLHIWAVSLSAIVGFYWRLRNKRYLTLSVTIFISLLSFYLLECSYILSGSNSLFIGLFPLIGFTLLFLFPAVSYFKKV